MLSYHLQPSLLLQVPCAAKHTTKLGIGVMLSSRSRECMSEVYVIKEVASTGGASELIPVPTTCLISVGA